MRKQSYFNLLLCTIMLFSILIVPASAKGHKRTEIDATNEFQIYAETACPGGNGIHQMKRRGIGDVTVKSTGKNLLVNKPCWQCVNCYTVMVTSGDPGTDWDIVGYYKSASWNGPVSIYGTIIWVAEGTVLNYRGARTLSGHRFYY